MTQRALFSRVLLTRVLIVLALTPAALGSLGAPPAHAQSGDTSAVAVNTKDNSNVFKLAFAIRRVAGDVVDQSNTAIAYASCNSCQTVAISFQILLITGSPSTITPSNVAIAINEGCTMCNTLASAYQFVFGGDGPLRFTREGIRRIAEIRQQLRHLGSSGLSIQEIQSRADQLAGELRTVLANDLTASGPRSDWGKHGNDAEQNGQGRDQSGQAGPGAQTTPTETTPPPTETTPGQTTPTQTTPTQTETTPSQTTPTPSQTTPTQTTPTTTQTTPTTTTTTPSTTTPTSP